MSHDESLRAYRFAGWELNVKLHRLCARPGDSGAGSRGANTACCAPSCRRRSRILTARPAARPVPPAQHGKSMIGRSMCRSCGCAGRSRRTRRTPASSAPSARMGYLFDADGQNDPLKFFFRGRAAGAPRLASNQACPTGLSSRVAAALEPEPVPVPAATGAIHRRRAGSRAGNLSSPAACPRPERGAQSPGLSAAGGEPRRARMVSTGSRAAIRWWCSMKTCSLTASCRSSSWMRGCRSSVSNKPWRRSPR